MKVTLLIFVIYINYVFCASDKYAVKSYPKKIKPYGTGKILIQSGKFMLKPNKQKTTSKSGKYTVFQVIANSKAVQGVPDSPYFPADQIIDQKPRVKKVLPDYVWSSIATRQKRSATVESKTENTPELNKENKTEIKSTSEMTNVKLDAKSEKPETKNEKAQFRSSDNNSSSTLTDAKKEDTKEEKKAVINSETKAKTDAVKDSKSDIKSTGTTKKGSGLKKSKNKTLSRDNSKNSKARKGARSKTRLRGKRTDKNGTAAKKPKGKRQGRSKTKSKQNKKNQPLRQQKSNQTQKGSKSSKLPKKDASRKGNSTNIKISKETRRLTTAREALIEDYPYVVSIQKDSEHWCSGALLNPRLVITTANCLWKSSHMSRMKVRAGSSYTDHGGQLANIQEVIKHPKWGLRKSPDNDLALISLDRNIKFSHSVHGVDLPNRAMMPAFEDAWVASWGAERRDGIFEVHENTLQVYHSYTMSMAACNNITRRFGITVTDNFICFTQSGKTAPCTRDTGAPAVSDGVLWGLASWGLRKLCGTERFPAMFSYTASQTNMDFIANATMYMMADERFYPFVDRPPVAKIAKTTHGH